MRRVDAVVARLRRAVHILAIDFETADSRPESACALGFAEIVDGALCQSGSVLINPGKSSYVNTAVHGISREMLTDAPPFADAWSSVVSLWERAELIVAHNASFDRRVVMACARKARMSLTPKVFACTLRMAQDILELRDGRLHSVCAALGIALDHHDPESDARAAAEIALVVRRRCG